MRRRLPLLSIVAIALAALLIALAILFQTSRPAGADTTSDEARFVELINDLRRDQGLGALTLDLELSAGAEAWTSHLRDDGQLSHAPDLSIGVTGYWLKLGENVGVAPVDQIQSLFDAFVASPDHYANLIDPDFTAVGVAVLYDDEGRMWTTHRFMELGQAPATTSAPNRSPSTSSPPVASTPTTPPATSTVPAATPAPAASTGGLGGELVAARAPLATDVVAELLSILTPG